MKLMEALTRPFIKNNNEIKKPSSTTNPNKVASELSDEYFGAIAFSNIENGLEGYDAYGDQSTPTHYQNKIIQKYRNLASDADVDYAIDLIVNEMIFSTEDKVLQINIDNKSSKVNSKIEEKFNKIMHNSNIQENIEILCRQLYIDGQLNVALVYDKSELKAGVKKISILEPFNLFYNKDDKLWRFLNVDRDSVGLYDTDNKFDEEYTNDELVHVDFKIYKNINLDEDNTAKINLGYLEKASKYVNQLSTLESLLVPLRYSRSVSRRLFNIDVAELPPKKAKELMNQIRNEFKYKKTYDTETGTIKNLNATQPLVEDYWLSNRNGGRGTTVEVMDEAGSLMDMEDIIHVTKKLFTSLKIPSSRNPYLDENGGDFSYTTDSTNNEDVSFYLFVDKLRKPICSLFKRILKREVIYSGDLTEQEWDNIEKDITITFSSKSIFLENMKKDLFLKGIGNFQDIKDDIGKIVSLETAIKSTMGWSTEIIQDELEKIKKEKSNPLYNNFYSGEEF